MGRCSAAFHPRLIPQFVPTSAIHHPNHRVYYARSHADAVYLFAAVAAATITRPSRHPCKQILQYIICCTAVRRCLRCGATWISSIRKKPARGKRSRCTLCSSQQQQQLAAKEISCTGAETPSIARAERDARFEQAKAFLSAFDGLAPDQRIIRRQQFDRFD